MAGTAAALAVAVVGAVVTNALAPDAPKPQKAPDPVAPTLMPDQQATDAAKKKAMLTQAAASGRASTILTDTGDSGNTLGG